MLINKTDRHNVVNRRIKAIKKVNRRHSSFNELVESVQQPAPSAQTSRHPDDEPQLQESIIKARSRRNISRTFPFSLLFKEVEDDTRPVNESPRA